MGILYKGRKEIEGWSNEQFIGTKGKLITLRVVNDTAFKAYYGNSANDYMGMYTFDYQYGLIKEFRIRSLCKCE